MAKNQILSFRDARPSEAVLVFGPEDFLAGRAIRAIREQLRAADENLEIHDLDAAEYSSGLLDSLASPSLFGEPRLIIIRSVERCSDDLIEDGVRYVQNPAQDVTVIFRHNGSSVRGKKLLEALRSVAIEIPVLSISKDSERAAFVAAEFEVAGRKITPGATRALLDAFSEDLAELASACSQLLQDAAETITEDIVDRYYSGRVETNAFKVIDAALAANSASALALLRHALSSGAETVPLVAAAAMKIRQLAKLYGNRSASAQTLGMAPWQLDRARKDLTGWDEEGLAAVISALVDADAAAKGARRDPEFVLEQLVLLIASKGKLQ